MLGSCLVPFHFLWAILSTSTVQSQNVKYTVFPWALEENYKTAIWTTLHMSKDIQSKNTVHVTDNDFVLVRIGGYDVSNLWSKKTEVYSTDGTCNTRLEDLPVGFHYPV